MVAVRSSALLGVLVLVAFSAVCVRANCPAPAVFNEQGVCLCEFADACVGSACSSGSVQMRTGWFQRTTHPIDYFIPPGTDGGCADCKCVPSKCPPGSAKQSEEGECICQAQAGAATDTLSQLQSVCTGTHCFRSSVGAQFEPGRARRQRPGGMGSSGMGGMGGWTGGGGQQSGRKAYVDWFYPSCTDCKCSACPVGTFKDEDGDCQCPLDTYCEGSTQCRESTVEQYQHYFWTVTVGAHLHFFAPSCTTCTCNGDALLAFGKTEHSAIRTDLSDAARGDVVIKTLQGEVAAHCAELCLDEPGCNAFTQVKGVGTCVLMRYHTDAVAETKPSIRNDMYIRIFEDNLCDVDNGGCGNNTQVACSIKGALNKDILCTQIDECALNNGGCMQGQICDDTAPMTPPTCIDMATDGSDDDDGNGTRPTRFATVQMPTMPGGGAVPSWTPPPATGLRKAPPTQIFMTTGDVKVSPKARLSAADANCLETGDPSMKCKSEMAASRAAASDGGEDEEDGGISTGIWVLIVIAVVVVAVVIAFVGYSLTSIKKPAPPNAGFNNPMYHMDAPDPNTAAHDDVVTYMELPGAGDSASSASNLFPRSPSYADAEATNDGAYQELPGNSPGKATSGYQDIHPNANANANASNAAPPYHVGMGRVQGLQNPQYGMVGPAGAGAEGDFGVPIVAEGGNGDGGYMEVRP